MLLIGVFANQTFKKLKLKDRIKKKFLISLSYKRTKRGWKKFGVYFFWKQTDRKGYNMRGRQKYGITTKLD